MPVHHDLAPIPGLPPFPTRRLRVANQRPVGADGRYVLYWMTAARRPGWSFALDRAADWARHLGLPLLVFEGLRAGYRFASDRHHRYVLDGMAANAAAFATTPARYLPYVEPAPGAGRGLLATLASGAAVVVGDDSPASFLPAMLAAAARQVAVRLELVDGNGLLPLGASNGPAAPSALVFRRLLQRQLPTTLADLPRADPFAGGLPPWPAAQASAADAAAAAGAAREQVRHLGHDPGWAERLPAGFLDRWPVAPQPLLAGDPSALADLPIDHEVTPVEERGGHLAGAAALRRFVDERLDRYAIERNEPEATATSELSAYLHYGQVGAHQVFAAVAGREGWTPGRLGDRTSGARQGWWGMSEAAEAFLDQLVTWRELAFDTAARLPDYDRYTSLPDWARRSLDAHACDPRGALYTLAELEQARTHDPLWNAAQRQLRREGRIHTYLRMLWGKKVLEWSPSAPEAWNRLVALNDRWATDGRDPNSIAGIAWCLGRYDRPWPPVRPIFGSVRYMSSENTARKMRVKGYLERYGPLV